MITLDERDIRVLEIIRERKVVRLEEIRSMVGGDGVSNSLEKLKDMGYITSIEFTGSKGFAITNKGMRIR